MTIRPWPEHGRRNVAKLKVFDVVAASRRSPRTAQDHEFFIVDTWDWVNIVALTDDEQLLLVRQYRHGTEEVTLEIPGGVIHPGEDPGETAARELREETGYAADEIVHLGTVRPNPAIMTNRCHSYLARGCRRVGELQQDAGEDIEVVTIPMTEVDERLRRGEIDHALALNGIHFYRLYCERGA